MYYDELTRALERAVTKLGLEIDHVEVMPPRDASHGDASTNAALILAKKAGRNPRELAAELVDALELPENYIDSSSIAGPGFLNFWFGRAWYESVLRDVVSGGDAYGTCEMGKGKSVQIEFVSANPTGPSKVRAARCSRPHA